MHPEFTPSAWSSFFSAQVGGSAALVGLIFVAVSINLKQIVQSAHLVARAAKALFTLVGVLVTSILCLVPMGSLPALGGLLLVVGALLWWALVWTDRGSLRNNPYASRRAKLFYPVLTQLSVLPLLAAGGSLFAKTGGGLYWIVFGFVCSYLIAVVDAWVLLIEIQR